MGTTTVMALLTNDYLIFGNIGDSSGFVYKNGKLTKVTKDHTLVNLLVAAGDLTEEEAINKKNELEKDDHDYKVTVIIKSYNVKVGEEKITI